MNPAVVTATVPVDTVTVTVEARLLDAHEVHSATTAQPAPTPEQIQAAEAVFSQRSQPDLAFGLFAVWTSTVLLRDLAIDAFSSTEEERPRAAALRLDEPRE
jgi:hypothetical protein